MFLGSFEIEIPANSKKEVSFICSLESDIDQINVKKVINKEIIRINEMLYNSGLVDSKEDITKMTR